MVDTALWVAEHVPAGDTIAAHDIGALGYFDNHTLIDLAGLVSPEVVPFIRDEARLAALLDERKVRYLIAFPALYPELAGSSRIVHASRWEVRSRGRARQHDRVLLALPVRFGTAR